MILVVNSIIAILCGVGTMFNVAVDGRDDFLAYLLFGLGVAFVVLGVVGLVV